MRLGMKVAGATLAAGLGLAASAQAGVVLEGIKKNDSIRCGVNTGLAGFSLPNSQGQWEGIDVDYCKALAAAILKDANKVKYVPLSTQTRFTAVSTGEVDVLSRNTTWTLTRDTQLQLNFAGVVYYDGQGFMVKKSLGVKSAKELDGATICVQPGTTTEVNMADYFRRHKMKFTPVVIEDQNEVVNSYVQGRCDVFTSDGSQLASVRVQSTPNPDDHVILPERISKEPLGPAVRQDDAEFTEIARWVLGAMVEAEEKGIDSKNVDEMKKSDDPDIKRILGVTPGNGAALGLDEEWAYRVVKQVGNYGETYKRNLTEKLKLDRGLNALWRDGGLMYTPPLR